MLQYLVRACFFFEWGGRAGQGACHLSVLYVVSCAFVHLKVFERFVWF